MAACLRSERCLIGIFLALIFIVPLWQVITELRRGEKPQALDVLRQKPTAANLRAYERDLEDASEAVKLARPWAQYAQFAWFKDGGEKAIVGNDGWLFYGPGVHCLTERQDARKGNTSVHQALEAIVSFRDQLAARGVQLLVVPAPNKESVYPERLTRRLAQPGGIVSEDARALLSGLKQAGVEVLDLWETFAAAKSGTNGNSPSYLAQDSHWSPSGLAIAARAVAQRIAEERWLAPGQVEYEVRQMTGSRIGDILRMLKVPALERRSPAERILCQQVVHRSDGTAYRDDAASEVLVLGDSFSRIFETDEPGSAGFIAHLAKELRRPVTSLVNDGGASTLVRQELARRPALLAKKKVVIWEFVERDIRLGTDGWQMVRLSEPRNSP
ncbi:MAG TPA: hypothetical protein VJA21_17100 [Verrucomicrobiae bacterium]